MIILVGITGCGVKGKPLPPLTAPNIGRGKPTFSGRPDRISLDELNKRGESDDSDSENQKRGTSE